MALKLAGRSAPVNLSRRSLTLGAIVLMIGCASEPKAHLPPERPPERPTVPQPSVPLSHPNTDQAAQWRGSQQQRGRAADTWKAESGFDAPPSRKGASGSGQSAVVTAPQSPVSGASSAPAGDARDVSAPRAAMDAETPMNPTVGAPGRNDPPAGAGSTQAVWGPAPDTAGVGLVYPSAPPAAAVSAAMIDALQLADSDPKRKVVGVWEQADGPADADFANGGYRQTVLTFRTDGVLDVTRYYGERNQVRIDSRFNYMVKADGTLEISSSTKHAAPERPGPLRIPAGKNGQALVVEAPSTPLPATLRWTRDDQGLIVGAKTYRLRGQTVSVPPAGPK
jgi:hypothetical protein